MVIRHMKFETLSLCTIQWKRPEFASQHTNLQKQLTQRLCTRIHFHQFDQSVDSFKPDLKVNDYN